MESMHVALPPEGDEALIENPKNPDLLDAQELHEEHEMLKLVERLENARSDVELAAIRADYEASLRRRSQQ